MIDSDIARVREALDLIPRGITVVGDVEDTLNRLEARLQEAERKRDGHLEQAVIQIHRVTGRAEAAEVREVAWREDWQQVLHLIQHEWRLKDHSSDLVINTIEQIARGALIRAE